MGSVYVSVKMPAQYSEDELKKEIKRVLKINDFIYHYDLKSLDARQPRNIHWQIRLLVLSDELKEEVQQAMTELIFPHKKRTTRVAVVGTGPAGFFAAQVLTKAGFQVTMFERGGAVEERAVAIRNFETNQHFSPESNYVFGEGGAGTFSDGKLTSRTKGISVYKQYVLQNYIAAGAPEEIRYLSKPHIGSNNLRNVVMNLRKQFLESGGQVHFNTEVSDIISTGSSWKINTNKGQFDCDVLIWASGHSAYDSFRMLISKGVKFIAKPFALGVRVEHNQAAINHALWKKPQIEGLKAADYVLRWQGENQQSAYSFCMCPGGKVVQAAPRKGLSIVNGMSSYQRNSHFANSAIVVPVHPSSMTGKQISASEMIDKIEALEQSFWNLNNSFAIPANSIASFLNGKVAGNLPETSYSHGVFPLDFNEVLDKQITHSLRKSLAHFSQKIKGFEDGIMLGLESKTSCAIQVERVDNNGHCSGFNNLYVTGEGSGYAGGIISSAVDGIKSAMHIIGSFN